MKNWKRTLSMLMIAALPFAGAACSDNGGDTGTTGGDTGVTDTGATEDMGGDMGTMSPTEMES